MINYKNMLQKTLLSLDSQSQFNSLINGDLLSDILSDNELVEWCILNLSTIDSRTFVDSLSKNKQENKIDYKIELDLIFKILEKKENQEYNSHNQKSLNYLISSIPCKLWDGQYREEMIKIIQNPKVNESTLGSFGYKLKEFEWFIDLMVDNKKLDLSYHKLDLNTKNTERICKIIDIHLSNLDNLSELCLLNDIVINFALEKIEDENKKNKKVYTRNNVDLFSLEITRLKRIQKIANSIDFFGTRAQKEMYKNLFMSLGVSYKKPNLEDSYILLDERVKIFNGCKMNSIITELITVIPDDNFKDFKLFQKLISSINELFGSTQDFQLNLLDFDKLSLLIEINKKQPWLKSFLSENDLTWSNMSSLEVFANGKQKSIELQDFFYKLENHLLYKKLEMETPINQVKGKALKF